MKGAALQDPLPEVPEHGNKLAPENSWTEHEQGRFDETLKAWARWEVNYTGGFVASPRCEGVTTNVDAICDACKRVVNDESFKAAVRRKVKESQLPKEEQHAMHEARKKFTPSTLRNSDARAIENKLKDPLIFDAYQQLQRGNDTECFLRLFKAARDGQLKEEHQTFHELCAVFADQLKREQSANKNLKYGIRYPKNYLNFMVLVRSYGASSARQYGIITSQLGGPSPRHLRTLAASSEDALQNPYLIYENIARVKRFVDFIRYKGPLVVAGDCTKLKGRLTYSNDFGSHILGSVLPSQDCEVHDVEDIAKIIDNIKKKNAIASQVRAILIQIPLPQYPPQVIALLPHLIM